MRTIRFATICIAFFTQVSFANPASILKTENLPPDFVANYDVHKGSMRVGKMEVRLKKMDSELIYESTTKPVGMAAFFLGDQVITDRAVLKLFDDHYHPIEFKHEMKNSDKNRNEFYTFDWESNKASIEYRDTKNTIDIPEYTYDNYSVQLLLMRKPNEEHSNAVYSVISKGKLKEYEYQREENELITTKAGKFDTSKFVRRKDNDKKTTYYGWYAEKLNYIPVKLDKFENGKLDVSIRLTSVEWSSEAAVDK